MSIESHYGESSPFSLGVEEELMVLDPETLALAPRAHEVIERLDDGSGRFKPELFASMLETATPICPDAPAALGELRSMRGRIRDEAGALGVETAAAGSHPFSEPTREEIADADRYREMVALLGVTARRQGVTGLHVHVGMPSGDACHRALEGVLPWLPVVLAISANSPYLGGEETGHASNRAEVLAQLPRSGAPPPCASYADWESFVDRFTRLGLVKDYTQFWWDVRPHPRLGTLEIRMPDQPTSVARAGALAALIQALAATALERDGAGGHGHAGRGLYEQNRWSALRHGPRAQLAHPDDVRLVPVPELAAELVELVRPAARDLGGEELLAELDLDRCEGDRQLELGRAGDLRAVAADLVKRSVA
jgi:carboxylate-amine ligase